MTVSPDGAVVIRDGEPDAVLQGLRTALSLALGDRAATVYTFGPAVGALGALTGEAADVLAALHEAGVAVVANPDPVVLAAAGFQQTF